MFLLLENQFEKLLSSESKNAINYSAKMAEQFGVNIFLIGGIVRDLIMNNKIKDIDISVEGDAIDFAQLLVTRDCCKIIQIQEKLRTAKVCFSSGIEIDFASTREETYLKSGVLPVAHNFGCLLEKDVKRRDFTINTLAMVLCGTNKYNLVDYYGGYQDILDKKIKVLHEKSFIDDPSRIIRTLKFKERFDFDIDEQTQNLMDYYLKNPDVEMPLERVKSELKQYFSIEKINIYSELVKLKAYKLVSKEPLTSVKFDRFKDIERFDLYKKSDMPCIYSLLLMINSDFGPRLNLTSDETKIISQVREMMSLIIDNDNEKIYKIFSNKENIALVIYYLITGEKSLIKFLTELRGIKVLTTGNDLIKLGYIPSKQFSEIFDSILKEKLRGNLKTKEEEIEFIKKESR